MTRGPAVALVFWLAACENPRAPMVCGETPEQLLYADEATTLIVCFADPNDDMLSYAAETSEEEVATATVRGDTVVVTGVAPGTALATVTATDPTGLKGTARFGIIVPNRAPAVAKGIPEHRIQVGDSVTVDLSGYFRDPDGQDLTYAAAPSDTDFITVSRTGSVLTVTARSKGLVSVEVTAVDPGGLAARQDFGVTVPNRGPGSVDSIPERIVAVGDTVAQELARYFSDPDGDSLTWAATSSDTVRVTVYVSRDTVRVTALAKGVTTVNVTATDVEGLSAVQEFSVIVPNRAPVAVGEIRAEVVEVEGTATLQLSSHFTDPDDDPLVFAAAATDTSVVVVSVAEEILTVAGVAKGTVTVTVTATDTEELSATQQFGVKVPNRAPLAVGAVPARTVAAGHSAALNLSGYFADPDGDSLVYAAAVSDSAVASAAVAGTVLTLTAAAKGEATATITATDTEGLSAVHMLTVTVPNRAPAMEDEMPPRIVQAGETVVAALPPFFSDPDGDPLSFAAIVSDTAVARVSVAGEDLKVAAAAKGEAAVTVTATDTEGLSAVQVFMVTVPNRKPLAVGEIPAATVAAGQDARLDMSSYFTDPDGDALVYTAAVSDSAVARGAVAGVTVAVTALGKGEATLTITAIDPEGLSAVQAFAVTVPNRAPVVERRMPPDTLGAGEHATLRMSPHFSDPDGDILAFAASASDTAVAGVSVAGETLTVAARAKGTATVTVSAADPEGLVVTQEFAVAVPNRAPSAARAIPPDTIAAEETATLDLSRYFTDPDADPLAFSATSTDASVAGSSVVGVHHLSVTAIARGRATLTVAATDPEGLVASQEFTVTVPNRPPLPAGPFDRQAVTTGDTTALQLPQHFTDPDGDRLDFKAVVSDTTVARASTLGPVLTIVAVARGKAGVAVTAADPEGLMAVQDLALTVSGRAPSPVGTMPQRRVTKGGIARADPSSYFADPDGDSLEFEAASSDFEVARTWVSRGTILIKAVEKGSATITITATDEDGLSATQQFNVRVRKSNGSDSNRPPRAVGRIVDQDLETGDSRSIDASAYFSDPDGDDLTFTASSSDDDLASVAVSGDTVTVRSEDLGTATVTITARDPGDLTTSLEFDVTVSEPTEENRPPRVVGEILSQELEEGDSRAIGVSTYFSDPDGDDLTFTASSSDKSVATAPLSGETVTVRSEASGTATVTITARDPDSLAASLEFDVTVSEPTEENRPPAAVGTIPARSLEEDDSITIDASVHFVDPDGDDLTFTASSSDDDLASVAVSGDTVTVRSEGLGTATVTITARDPDDLTTSLEFDVTVSEPPEENRAPVVIGAMDAQTLEKGDSMKMDAAPHFSDPDGDDLEFSAASSDSGVVVPRVTGSELFITTADTGSATLSVTAWDPEELSATVEFDVTVEPLSPRVSICNRTPAVRDLLLSLAEASSCTSVKTRKMGSITRLRLHNAGISSLQSHDFEGLAGLSVLELYGNTLEELPSDVFSGMSSLAVLQLSYNRLESLPPDVFSSLSSLEQLNIGHNALTELPGDVFSGLNSLLYLYLNGNDIASLPPTVFQDQQHLELLFLYGNNLTTLPSGVFSGLTSLRWVTLEDCELTTLAAGTLSGLSSLDRLELSGNDLNTLPADLLAGTPGLRNLTLGDNRLKGLPDGLLAGLPSLRTLWLHGNDIDPMPIEISLISEGGGKVKATVSSGAPFTIEVPLTVENGTIEGDSTITIPAGSLESAAFTVIPGDGGAEVDVGTLPSPPGDSNFTSSRGKTHPAHHGYRLTRSADLPLTVNEE